MIIGGYDLHLYCQYKNSINGCLATWEQLHSNSPEIQTEFAGCNSKDCKKQARKNGWKF